MDQTPPTKPSRSLGSGSLDPPQSPKSPTSPTSPDTPGPVKPVLSAYGCVQFPNADNQVTKQPEQSKDKNDHLYADPTYDTVNDKAASKSETLDPAADLYDIVEARTTKTSPSKKTSRASDPSPRVTVPPPLPARLPSMSGMDLMRFKKCLQFTEYYFKYVHINSILDMIKHGSNIT